MDGRVNMAVLLVVVASALLQSTYAQTTYVVGETMGWLTPSSGSVPYSTWASSHNFTVGDILVFNFTTGRHDVAKVTKQAYDTCNTNTPISLITAGPANVILNSTGANYFICTFNGHCAGGQKLAIDVTAASSGPTASPPPPPVSTPSPPGTVSPSPPPPTAGGTTSPPPPSSASSAAVATFSVIFMSVAIGFLC